MSHRPFASPSRRRPTGAFEAGRDLWGDPRRHADALLHHHRTLLWRAARSPQPFPEDGAAIRVDVDEPISAQSGRLPLRVVGTTKLYPGAPSIDRASGTVVLPLHWEWFGLGEHVSRYDAELRLCPEAGRARLTLAGRRLPDASARAAEPGIGWYVIQRRAHRLLEALAEAFGDIMAIYRDDREGQAVGNLNDTR